LLDKQDWRAAVADEPKEHRPEVSRVLLAFPFARDREGLAGARGCPNRSVAPAGKLECAWPAQNSAEEMMLSEAFDVFCFDFLDRPFIDFSIRDKVGANQFAHPLANVFVAIIVIRPLVHCVADTYNKWYERN
jgi:hypothetical protein